MTWHLVRFAFFSMGLCASLLATPIWAAGAQPRPLAQSLNGEAKADYESAKLLFEDGDSLGALAKFSHAYELSREPELLWNMAVCEKMVRHYGRTATLVERYLKESGKRISAEQRNSAVATQTALHAFYSTLTINGAPIGATISVDGEHVGEAPLQEPLLIDLGTRSLRVEQPGFEAFESKLEVPGGQTLTVDVTLKPIPVVHELPARLSIVTSGAQDIVAIDGKVLGSHIWEGVLPVGEHWVRVSAAHKKTYESHVQLSAGGLRSLQITLEDEAHASKTWLWVTGGVMLAAGATLGGYFLFKPEDSAARPHPTGKLSTVYLPLDTGSR